MRRALQTVAVCGIIFGIFWMAVAQHYSLGSLIKPGPGLYPFLVGSLIILGSIGCGLDALSQSTEIDWPQPDGWWRIIAVVATIILYIVILPFVGHVVAGIVPMVVVMLIMGGLRWYLNISLAVLISVALYYLFRALSIPLLKGIWIN